LHNEIRDLYVVCTKYYVSDQIKEDEMGGAFVTHGRDEKCIQNFVGNHEVKRPLGEFDVRGRILLK